MSYFLVLSAAEALDVYYALRQRADLMRATGLAACVSKCTAAEHLALRLNATLGVPSTQELRLRGLE